MISVLLFSIRICPSISLCRFSSSRSLSVKVATVIASSYFLRKFCQVVFSHSGGLSNGRQYNGDEDDYKRKIGFIAHARQPYGRFIETIVGIWSYSFTNCCIEAIIRLIRRRRAESMIIAFKTRSVWNVWLCEGLFRNIF